MRLRDPAPVFGLMMVAIAGVVAMAISDRRRRSRVMAVKLIVGSTILVMLLVIQFGVYRIFEKFAIDPMEDARIPFAHNTITAAKAYMPFGSGLGTFVSIYPTFEPAQDTISTHDDLLEIWLEGGAFSIILAAAFLSWLVLRSKKIWWRANTDIRPIDLLLARAATIAIPLLIAHSVVDYPLRTGAMMAVFAFACALLVEPVNPVQDELKLKPHPECERTEKVVRRVLATQGPTAASEPDGIPEKPPQPPQGRWGEDIDWPEEWRNERY